MKILVSRMIRYIHRVNSITNQWKFEINIYFFINFLKIIFNILIEDIWKISKRNETMNILVLSSTEKSKRETHFSLSHDLYISPIFVL